MWLTAGHSPRRWRHGAPRRQVASHGQVASRRLVASRPLIASRRLVLLRTRAGAGALTWRALATVVAVPVRQAASLRRGPGRLTWPTTGDLRIHDQRDGEGEQQPESQDHHERSRQLGDAELRLRGDGKGHDPDLVPGRDVGLQIQQLGADFSGYTVERVLDGGLVVTGDRYE